MEQTREQVRAAEAGGGNGATRPAEFEVRDWQRVAARIWTNIGAHSLSIIAAGIAFFGVFSIFPAIAALIALYGLVSDPAEIGYSLKQVEPFLPPDTYSILERQVTDLARTGSTTLGAASAISIGLALWSARMGVNALIRGLNIVYAENDRRNYVVQTLFSLMITLALIITAIFALLAVVAVPTVLNFLDLGPLGNLLARVAPLAILSIAVIFVIGGLYRYAPHRATARMRWVTPGALLAAFFWAVVSVGLSIYMSRFGDFNQAYGSLGAVVGLMFWLYASAFVVLLGAEVNASMELRTEHDTTTGPPQPIGERGAFVADHIA